MGHWYCYAPTDSYARFKRMQGYEVFEPMGFDSFGLPAENYAIKTGIHPAQSTANNIRFMREQLKRIGAMYDWDYEVVTSSPDYYKWTQWFFLLMYKRGLAYQKDALVNWCRIVRPCWPMSRSRATICASAATRQLNGAKCGSGSSGFPITIRDCSMDSIRLTGPRRRRPCSATGSGSRRGQKIAFSVSLKSEVRSQNEIRVFTTRADTLFGVTYVVLAPEHPLVREITSAERKGRWGGVHRQVAKPFRGGSADGRPAQDRCIHGGACDSSADARASAGVGGGLCDWELRHGRRDGGAGA